MKFYSKKANQLNSSEYRKLSNLNFRYEGLMYENLKQLHYINSKSHNVFICLSDCETQVIGWGLIYEGSRVMLYVRKSHRGKGIGSAILQMIIKKNNSRKNPEKLGGAYYMSSIFKCNGLLNN